jgi:hypothetical protein
MSLLENLAKLLFALLELLIAAQAVCEVLRDFAPGFHLNIDV